MTLRLRPKFIAVNVDNPRVDPQKSRPLQLKEVEKAMRIIGIGTDIIECRRIGRMIERHGEYFLQRVYTQREIDYCRAHRSSLERFAGRWAAKEAILKALGTGWRNGISWLDMEVRNETSGQPTVALGGFARDHARRQQIQSILISISHCRDYAVAYAMAVGPAKPGEGLFGPPLGDLPTSEL
jgi:holo-[acyl-carrier protein] synthase